MWSITILSLEKNPFRLAGEWRWKTWQGQGIDIVVPKQKFQMVVENVKHGPLIIEDMGGEYQWGINVMMFKFKLINESHVNDATLNSL